MTAKAPVGKKPESKADNGFMKKPIRFKVAFLMGNNFIEAGNTLVQLRADSTNKEIAKGRQFW